MTFYESLIESGYSPRRAYCIAYGEPVQCPPRRPWAGSVEEMEMDQEDE